MIYAHKVHRDRTFGGIENQEKVNKKYMINGKHLSTPTCCSHPLLKNIVKVVERTTVVRTATSTSPVLILFLFISGEALVLTGDSLQL